MHEWWSGLICAARGNSIPRDRHCAGKFKWAIAGRDSQKLENVRQELCKINPSLDVPILVADAKNAAQVCLWLRTRMWLLN
jgi:short subunit dehydrogenase-like uncharacterized protein